MHTTPRILLLVAALALTGCAEVLLATSLNATTNAAAHYARPDTSIFQKGRDHGECVGSILGTAQVNQVPPPYLSVADCMQARGYEIKDGYVGALSCEPPKPNGRRRCTLSP